jgi:membrane-associated phospholipid phosphatase
MWSGIMLVAEALAIWRFGWTVEWRPIRVFVGGVALLGAIGAFYHRTRRSDTIARLAFTLGLGLALALLCQTATYILAVIPSPYRGALLNRGDSALGFSWGAWNAWVRSRPYVERPFARIYPLHIAGTGFALVVLALRTRTGAQRFMRAFVASFGVSALGLIAVPALTHTVGARSNQVRFALRSGTFSHYDFGSSVGLISMPSMHAALAVLILVSLWRFHRSRIPLVLFCGIMIVATPNEGGHSLVDVIAGTALGAWSYWYAGRTL